MVANKAFELPSILRKNICLKVAVLMLFSFFILQSSILLKVLVILRKSEVFLSTFK